MPAESLEPDLRAERCDEAGMHHAVCWYQDMV